MTEDGTCWFLAGAELTVGGDGSQDNCPHHEVGQRPGCLDLEALQLSTCVHDAKAG